MIQDKNKIHAVDMSSMAKLVTFVLSAAFAVTGSMALATDPCSELAYAKSFSFGQEVEGGKELSYEKAFSRVLHLPHPEYCFLEIVSRGNHQGKMFALVALREIDPTQFRASVKLLEGQRFSVVTLFTEERGIVAREASDTVIKQISNGVFKSAFQFHKKHWQEETKDTGRR